MYITVGLSRPTSSKTASSQPVHGSHDQMRVSGDQSVRSHDTGSSVVPGSKRSELSHQV